MIKIYVENQNHECAIENSKLKTISFAYAHGKLERRYHYDIIKEDRLNHFDKRHSINGEECIAVLPNGKEVKSKFFYWKVVHVRIDGPDWLGETYRHVWVQPRGLLVEENDHEAVKYAQKCFNEKKRYL